MNVVSFTEDICDRLIEDVQNLRGKLIAIDVRGDQSEARLKQSEVRLKFCEAVCERLLAQLEQAKKMAADPELARALRIDFLQIENGRLKRELEQVGEELDRVRSKFESQRQLHETALTRQMKRAVEAENTSRALRNELRGKNKAIAHFRHTHDSRTSPKKPGPPRRKRARS